MILRFVKFSIEFVVMFVAKMNYWHQIFRSEVILRLVMEVENIGILAFFIDFGMSLHGLKRTPESKIWYQLFNLILNMTSNLFENFPVNKIMIFGNFSVFQFSY